MITVPRLLALLLLAAWIAVAITAPPLTALMAGAGLLGGAGAGYLSAIIHTTNLYLDRPDLLEVHREERRLADAERKYR